MVESGSRRTQQTRRQEFFRVGRRCHTDPGVGWFLTFPVYGSVGSPPRGRGAAPGLRRPQRRMVDDPGLMVFTDLIYVVVWVTLYEALKRIDRIMMLLALASHLLFVVLDLAVTWTNHAALFTLGSQYVAAAQMRSGRYAGGCGCRPPSWIHAGDHLLHRYPLLGNPAGGLVMLKGGFGKLTGWLALPWGSRPSSDRGTVHHRTSDPSHIINALIATVMYVLGAGGCQAQQAVTATPDGRSSTLRGTDFRRAIRTLTIEPASACMSVPVIRMASGSKEWQWPTQSHMTP